MEPYPGTNKLGRPLTDDEKKKLGAQLRAHEYPKARLKSVAFGYRLTHRMHAAQDLAGRADLRFVRVGWNPRQVVLVRRLCRLVWSEWTHEIEESDAARRAEEAFLRAEAMPDDDKAPSPEDRAEEIQASMDARAHAVRQIDRMRAAFEATNDQVNLDWLRLAEQEITDIGQMVPLTGHSTQDFYRATDRRTRLVKRLVEEDEKDRK